MPHALLTLAIAAAVGCAATACSTDRVATPQNESASVAASRQMADGKEWTTNNLSINIDGSFCYDGSEVNCGRYGRLYTWDAAQRGCGLLGPGWHLPSEDEWRELARRYGGIREDSRDEGASAYHALSSGGDSGFNALLGGGRDDGQFARLEAHGFYWTATDTDPAGAWFYNFGKGGLALNRQREGSKQMAVSVRCIKG